LLNLCSCLVAERNQSKHEQVDNKQANFLFKKGKKTTVQTEKSEILCRKKSVSNTETQVIHSMHVQNSKMIGQFNVVKQHSYNHF